MNNQILANEKIHKSYLSKDENILFFDIEYTLSFFKDKEKRISNLIVDVHINWKCFASSTYVKDLKIKTNMRFSQKNDGDFTVDDLILPEIARNQNVGTLVLNDVFKLARKYIEGASVKFRLSPIDETTESSKNRRNHFYEKFNLKLSESQRSYYGILCNLKTYEKINKIEEVDACKLFHQKLDMLERIKKLEKLNSRKSDMLKLCERKKEKIIKFFAYIVISIFSLAGLFGVLFDLN